MTDKLAAPVCTHTDLAFTELTPGLTARACQGCGGHLLDIEDLRRWTAQQPQSSATDSPLSTGGSEQAVPDSSATARACLCCTRLMQRVRVAVQPDFRIDRCAPCQTLWLDPGEWSTLWHAGMVPSLLERLADAWQRKIQEEEIRQRRDATLRAKYGDQTMDELNRVRAWLKTQPQREELIALLRLGD